MKNDLDKKNEEIQKGLRDVMKERKEKVNNDTEAKQAKLDLTEQNSRYKNLESQLKRKDEEVDNKRQALQNLQNEYQTVIGKNWDLKQGYTEKDTKIKELENEVNRMKKCTQTPDKKKY